MLQILSMCLDLGKFCNAWIDAARLKHTAFILKSTVINSALRQTEFAIQHDDSDKYLIASGIPYTFVRPTLLMVRYLRLILSPHDFLVPCNL